MTNPTQHEYDDEDDQPEAVEQPKPKRKPRAAAKTADKTPEKVVLDDGWKHERIKFQGDNLAIRKPTQRALTGVTLGSSKFITPDTSTAITGKFIELHLGPQSYNHFYCRLMDPDDDGYTDETLRELIEVVAKAGVGANESDDKAK